MFYVDYGTVAEVAKKNVRFLAKNFSKQPCYALRGCLDRVKPNDGIWSIEAMNEFEKRLHEFFSIAILAKVTAINAAVSISIRNIDCAKCCRLIAIILIKSNYYLSGKDTLFGFDRYERRNRFKNQ